MIFSSLVSVLIYAASKDDTALIRRRRKSNLGTVVNEDVSMHPPPDKVLTDK
jgi:hypothetical protein